MRAALETIAQHVRLGPSTESVFPQVRLVKDPSAVLSNSRFLVHVSQLMFLRGLLTGEYERMLGEVEELRGRVVAGQESPDQRGDG